MPSLARQNFSEETEAEINSLVGKLNNLSYAYLSIAYYFGRDDKALANFHKYFLNLSESKREMAQKLMHVQNLRGGRIVLDTIVKPNGDDWGTPLETMEYALKMEKQMNTDALHMHTVVDSNNDPHMTDFVEDALLPTSVDLLKELAGHITNLKRVGPGLGEYLFDHETLE